MKHPYILAVLFLLTVQTSFPQIAINEIMQSNVNCLFVDNEFPNSWVELYNNSDATVALDGYRIGSKNKFDTAYELPPFTMSPHSYQLIYCDKAAKGFHTDFSLEVSKGKIYLFDSTGTIKDAIEYKNTLSALPLNISYVRNGNRWGYTGTPTPGADNAPIFEKILPEPIFNKSGRVYPCSQASDVISVSVPQDAPPGTIIRYTLDGSEPDENSPGSSTITLAIDTTTVIRAKLQCQGYISPVSTTHSYIFHPRETTLPIWSIVIDEDYLYGTERGILVDPNYKQDWRRPLNIEYFEGRDKEAIINQLGETRVQGGATRIFNQKSLAVYAKARYGKKSFDYPLWKKKPEVKKFKSFILRNAGNDCLRTHVRDAFVQTLFASKFDDLDWQAYEASICYINGKYKGIYNIRERSNDDYVYANYNGLEDIDMIENWKELKAGGWESYNLLRNIISDSLSTADDVDAIIDIDNFLKLFVIETWSENEDFPGNNIVMWRDNSSGSKWRWILKDIDFVGLIKSDDKYDDNYFDFLYRRGEHSNDNAIQNSEYATELFRFLMDKEPFREKFINSLAVYMGDFLQFGYTSELFKNMSSKFAPEYPHHLEAYDNFGTFNITMPLYATYFESMLYWLEVRHNYLYSHIADFFNLGTPVPLTIDRASTDVIFNGIALTQEKFNGKFFANKNISLEHTSDTLVWQITHSSEEGDHTYINNNRSIDIQLPEDCQRVEIRLVPHICSNTTMPESGKDTRIEIQENSIKITCKNHKIGSVQIYSAAGCLIAEHSSSPHNHCTIGKPENGIYILGITLDNGYTINEKIIIR